MDLFGTVLGDSSPPAHERREAAKDQLARRLCRKPECSQAGVWERYGLRSERRRVAVQRTSHGRRDAAG